MAVRFLLSLTLFFTCPDRGSAETASTGLPAISTGPGSGHIRREADFLIVRGCQLKRTLGREIRHLSLFASLDGRIQPVPFQVDEINPRGEWVLQDLPGATAETSGTVDRDDDGRLDENDELAFMIRDSGDRIPESGLPLGLEAADEIQLVDPLDGTRSWVYLCSFRSNPPLSERDYVDHRLSDNRVVSQDYELAFSPELPISWGHISFRGSPNMIDRLKIRLHLTFMGIPYYRDETHFRTTLSSYKDGPVRVIRRVSSSVRINRLLRTPYVASESVYYDRAVVIPFRMNVPVSIKALKGLFGEIRARGGADMQNMHAWRLRTDKDPRWLSIDGRMDDAERSIRGEGVEWFLLSGPAGAFLCRLILDRMPDGSPQHLPLRADFFYLDDDSEPDPPEFVPGQSPNLGFWLAGLEDLPKGTVYFYLICFMIRNYEDGVEAEYLKMIDRPVEAFVE